MRSIYLSLFTTLLLFCNRINAQDELFGKWEVFCPMETPLRYCDICSTEKHEKMGNVVYGFEMEFKKDSIYIINSGFTSEKVKYLWNKESRILTFNYQRKDYSFQLLNCGNWNNLILKDKTCLLLSITRKEEKR